MKILCRLGLHRWHDHLHLWRVKSGRGKMPYVEMLKRFRRCKRCKKTQIWRGFITQGEWVDDTRNQFDIGPNDPLIIKGV